MKLQSNWSTPKEITEDVQNCPFTASELGSLLAVKLLRGAKKNKITLIDLDSLSDLLEYRKKVILKEIQ